MCSGLIWLRIGLSGGGLQTHKLAEELSASQEGLFAIQLINLWKRLYVLGVEKTTQ